MQNDSTYQFKRPDTPQKLKAAPKTPAAIAPSMVIGNLPVQNVADLFTDMRLAEIFAGLYRDGLRFWPSITGWLVFDGRRWTSDNPGGAFPYVRRMVDHLYQTAMDEPDYAVRTEMLKNIIKLEEHKRQVTLLEASKTRPELIIGSNELDRHPMLLTVLNGTLDLENGELQPHRASDFITRMTPIQYDPSAECPRFMAFLNRIFSGNQAIVDYLQRFAGYCLTGKTSEQMLLFLYGSGCNGKSVLSNVLQRLLGDFSSTATADLLMARDRQTATNGIAALRGSRLCAVSEFDEGERLHEAQIKSFTGGDSLTCRFLHKEFFTFVPAFKIILIGNHRPKIRGTDYGIWRRLHLLNFSVTIPPEERDPDLQDKLLAELPGILRWAVQGCLEWQRIGLSAPAEVKAAVDEYKCSQDTFQQWLDDCCVCGADFSASASALLASFSEYAKQRWMTATRFGGLLTERGFIKVKSNTIIWRGIGLRQASKDTHWQEKQDDDPFP